MGPKSISLLLLLAALTVMQTGCAGTQTAATPAPEAKVVAKEMGKATTQAAPTPAPIPELIATPTAVPAIAPTITPMPPATPIPTPSEPLYSEDFEDGPAQDWSLGTGWQMSKEDGNTVLLGRDHYWANLTRGADWTDYAFKFRLKVRSAAVHLNYRIGANPFSRYFLSFSKERLTLTKQLGDDFTDMTDNRTSYRLNTWHTVEIKGFAGHLQVLVDGVLELDLTDEEPLLQGTIAFESLPGSEALIDDIEIWRLTEPLTTPTPPATPTPTQAPPPPIQNSLAGSVTDLSSEWIDPTADHNYTYQDRDEVPIASHIVISDPDSSGYVTVTGAPGAIPASAGITRKDRLRLASVDWGVETCVSYNRDGSFSARLLAGPGTTIILGAVVEASCQGQWIESMASALVRVPEGVNHEDPSVPFSISGRLWSATGELQGNAPHMGIKVSASDPFGCLVPRLHIYRLFDEHGEYAGQVNLNVHGPVMTPTGQPIETDQGPQGYWDLIKPLSSPCLKSSLSRYELGDWTASLEPGWYGPRLAFYTVDPVDPRIEHLQESLSQPLFGVEANTHIGYLPLLKVGSAQTLQIPATLLNESVSWGSGGIRGIVAKEDAERFALGSRRSAQGPFIASPRDPLSGRRLTYLLEPYLPTLAYTGFTHLQPQIPLIALDESALGWISVSLTKPGGEAMVLASKAPIVQSFLSGSQTNAYPVELSFAGPGRTYGVTTGLDSLEIEFDQYGLHTVQLEGILRTLWGQELEIRGTYEVWVAEPLDLSLGTFEGTPLEVGDQWSPVVVVEPGVPAQVGVTIDHYIDGDPGKKRSFSTTGNANAFGYFVANDTWAPDAHGEYITRVIASYTDPEDSTLWMGSRAGASIVATPRSPLVAHGVRDSQIAVSLREQHQIDDTVLRPWFILRSFDIEPIGLEYPFFRGDIAWLEDARPIGPFITLDDPQGVLATIAPQVAANRFWDVGGHGVEASDMKKLTMQTTVGQGGQHRKDAIDSWGYWYTSAVRPDISIQHTVSEIGAFHDHWYGHDSYNCQIGLPCFGAWLSADQGGRNGDEEGDIKLLFGGAVIKNADEQYFVPYASMATIIPEPLIDPATGMLVPRDPLGSRICPPYQGAAGGLATCGPILNIQGRDVDLFVTPTGTRPGSVLEIGDRFVFSGQAWPTLDVWVEITVTGPSGKVHSASDRANQIGYIDGEDKAFVVEEPGVYVVHVALTQDRPVPSTGLAPDPPVVADGQTLLSEYGYSNPLSAILGSLDSTYRFFVVESSYDVPAKTQIELGKYYQDEWTWHRVPSSITVTFDFPAGAKPAWQTVTIPGLIIADGAVSEDASELTVRLDREDLYTQGYTNVVLGAESLEITVVGTLNGQWFAKVVNLRGVSPLGGAPATVVISDIEKRPGR